MAVAYGSFLLAEEFGRIFGDSGFHLSGILAVVAAGLVVGNLGLQNTSPATRLTLEHFWELLTFLVNSMVFLVIGLTITLSTLWRELGAVLLGVVAVLVLRAVLVDGLAWVAHRIQPSRRIPMAYRHVMVWAGLRGRHLRRHRPGHAGAGRGRIGLVAERPTGADQEADRGQRRFGPVLVRAGDVANEISELVDATGGTEVLIGAPVPESGHNAVTELVALVEKRTGTSVTLIEA